MLGIDWGKSKIGLAIADSHNNMATPYGVVKNIKEVLAVIKQEDISVLVIGKPVHMSGTSYKLTAGFGEFIAQLAKETKLEINLFDERLSSKGAQKLFGDKKNKAKEDALAAMLILQNWIDKKFNYA